MRQITESESKTGSSYSRLRHVYVVESDDQGREALVAVCRQAGYATLGFAIPDEVYAARTQLQRPCCVLSALRPGGRAEWLRRLMSAIESSTLVFYGDSVDVEIAVELMKAGAHSVVKTSVPMPRLLSEIHAAVVTDEAKQKRHSRVRELRKLHSSLTDRESTILGLILEGQPNKSIARSLGFSVRSIENYRSKIYNKFEVSTPAELAVKATEYKLLMHSLQGLPLHPQQTRHQIDRTKLDASI